MKCHNVFFFAFSFFLFFEGGGSVAIENISELTVLDTLLLP